MIKDKIIFWRDRVKYIWNYKNFWKEDGKRGAFEIHSDEIQKVQNDFFLNIDKRLNPKSVLDVGCGWGRLLRLWGDRGTGVDLGAAQIGKADSSLKLIQADVTNHLPFEDNSFDLVYTSGVLMHIPPTKIRTARKEIYRVAKKHILLVESVDERPHMFAYDNTKWLKEMNCKIIQVWDENDYQTKKKGRKMQLVLAEKV